MSHEDIVRRARRSPSDPPTNFVGVMGDKVLLPGTGTSISLLPWWRRLLARIRGIF